VRSNLNPGDAFTRLKGLIDKCDAMILGYMVKNQAVFTEKNEYLIFALSLGHTVKN
jgi:hypothetical protein